MASEAVLQTLLSQVSQAIIRKLEKGKKLSTEEILLLYLDLLYSEIKETRREVNERIDERFRLLNERLESVDKSLSEKIDRTRTELLGYIREAEEKLTARINEINKRIDRLYEIRVEENK